MPELIHTQNYVTCNKADLYWIEKIIEKPLCDEVEFIKMINRQANASYLSTQLISDLTNQIIGEK